MNSGTSKFEYTLSSWVLSLNHKSGNQTLDQETRLLSFIIIFTNYTILLLLIIFNRIVLKFVNSSPSSIKPYRWSLRTTSPWTLLSPQEVRLYLNFQTCDLWVTLSALELMG